MNDSEVRKWVDEATKKIKDIVFNVASSRQLHEIEQIMDRLKENLINR